MGRHPEQDEFNDTTITVFERMEETLVESVKDETGGWCPNIQDQLAFNAMTMLVGRLYGAAMLHGVTAKSLDASLRQWLRLGRAQALDEHREGGCPGCPAATDLEQLVDLRNVC